MDKKELAKKIDHTWLRPDTCLKDIHQLCDEANEHGFFAVCLPPSFVSHAKDRVTNVKVATVIGFPLGYGNAKEEEARQSVCDGADELDMVMNIAAFKDGRYKEVTDEIERIAKTATIPLKVIIETCLLNRQEKITACHLVKESGASFIKTSTGFSHGGACIEDILLIKKELHNTVKIKASGGISNTQQALDFLSAGADRLGTSSGVSIVKGA